MTDNRYYIPDIEDIRIGYECEWMGNKGLEHTWIPMKLTSNYIRVAEEHGIQYFRVPYLTKEQIEAEGWESLEDKSPFTGKSYKWRRSREDGFNNWIIHTLEAELNGYIQIRLQTETSYVNEDKYIFCGKCPSINEFRTIMKLLWLI